MTHAHASIQELVRTAMLSGKVINVEAYCFSIGTLFPNLTQAQIRAEVIDAVCHSGGGAVWGWIDSRPLAASPSKSCPPLNRPGIAGGIFV